MVTKKSEPATNTPEEESNVAVDAPDVCEGCVVLREEFEAFREYVINNAQGM